jgi:hypothetical protein
MGHLLAPGLILLLLSNADSSTALIVVILIISGTGFGSLLHPTPTPL